MLTQARKQCVGLERHRGANSVELCELAELKATKRDATRGMQPATSSWSAPWKDRSVTRLNIVVRLEPSVQSPRRQLFGELRVQMGHGWFSLSAPNEIFAQMPARSRTTTPIAMRHRQANEAATPAVWATIRQVFDPKQSFPRSQEPLAHLGRYSEAANGRVLATLHRPAQARFRLPLQRSRRFPGNATQQM